MRDLTSFLSLFTESPSARILLKEQQQSHLELIASNIRSEEEVLKSIHGGGGNSPKLPESDLRGKLMEFPHIKQAFEAMEEPSIK